MALTVEDGTGKVDAQSYLSVSDATTYHSAHGNSAWAAAASDALREAALVRATASLDGIFGARWPGFRYSQTQALDWPRTGAWDRDGYPLTGVPQALKNACAEAALIELANPGALAAALDARGVLSERVGNVSTRYAPGASRATIYRAITQALGRIISGGGMVRVTR